MSAGSVSYGLWFKMYDRDRSYENVQNTIFFIRGFFLGCNKYKNIFAYASHFLLHFLAVTAQ